MADPDYFWFRHRQDGSTFIACLDGGQWFMPGIAEPIDPVKIETHATQLGPVPRCVRGGGSIDQ